MKRQGMKQAGGEAGRERPRLILVEAAKRCCCCRSSPGLISPGLAQIPACCLDRGTHRRRR